MNLLRTSLGVAVELPSGDLLPIRAIVGIGMNYAQHAREQGKEPPSRPVFFTKNPLAASLHNEPIRIPHICQDRPQVDFEAELGVLIGHPPPGHTNRDIPKDRALQHVLGYCPANDVSARWWQKEGSGGQFYRGKSFDSFCPLGPTITPANRVPNPNALRISCSVNGSIMQDANTSDMIFNVPTLIHELSRAHSILPGTLILTGTPSGVGFARNPPIYLQPGDHVRVTVESLGSLDNPVTLDNHPTLDAPTTQ